MSTVDLVPGRLEIAVSCAICKKAVIFSKELQDILTLPIHRINASMCTSKFRKDSKFQYVLWLCSQNSITSNSKIASKDVPKTCIAFKLPLLDCYLALVTYI